MASRISTLSKKIVAKFNEVNEQAEMNKKRIQTPSGDSNMTAETLVALSGLMAGIWGGSSALAMVKPGFDAKSVFQKGGVKSGKGISILVESSEIIKNILKNDNHILSEKGGKDALSAINNIDKNFVKSLTETTKFQKRIKNQISEIINILQSIKQDNRDTVNNLEKNEHNYDKDILELLTPYIDTKYGSQIVSRLDKLRNIIVDEFKNKPDITGSISKIENILNTYFKDNSDNIDKITDKTSNDIIKSSQLIVDAINSNDSKLSIELTGKDAESLATILENVSDPSYDLDNFQELIKGIQNLQNINNLNKVNDDIEKITSTLDNLMKIIPEDIDTDNIELAIGNMFNSIQHSLTKGVESIDNDEVISNINNSINNIFENINKGFESNKLDIDVNNIIEPLDNLQNSINSYNLEFDTTKILDPLNKLFDEITKVNEHQVVLNLDPLFSTLTTLKSKLEFDPQDTQTIKTNISNINEILNNVKNPDDNGSLTVLFKHLSDVVQTTQRSTQDINSLSLILRSVIDFLTTEIDPRNAIHAKQGISILSEIFDPSKGNIKKLFEDIKKLQDENKADISLALKNLTYLFNSIAAVAHISPFKMYGMKFNIAFLESYIMKDLISIMNQIGKLDNSVAAKDARNAINNLNMLFNTVATISELDMSKKLRMFINIRFIRRFMMKDLTKLMEDIGNVGAGTWKTVVTKDGKEIETLQSPNQVFQNAGYAITNLSNLFMLLMKVAEIDSKTRTKMRRNFSFIQNIIKNDISKLIKKISDIELDESFEKTQQINSLLTEFTSTFNNLPSLIKLVKDYIKILTINSSASQYSSFVNKINKIKINNDTINKVKQLKNIFDIFGEIQYVNVNTKELSKAIKTMTSAALKLALIGKLAKSVEAAAQVMKQVSKIFKSIIDNFSRYKKETIQKALDVLNGFSNIIVKTAAILIFGTLAMAIIMPKALGTFALCLGGFVGGILGIYAWSSKHLKDSLSSARALGMLILISGATLIIGGLFMKVIDVGELVAFGLTLGLFIMGVVGVLGIFGKNIKDSGNTLLNFAALVLVSGVVMILGGLLMEVINPVNLALFGVILAGFILATTIPLLWASKFIKNSFIGLSEFALLVLASGFVMILGGLFVDQINLGKLALFGLELALFMGITVTPLILFSRFIKSSFKGLGEFALLVLASGFVMILGGLLVDQINLGKLALFGLELGLFILMVSGAYILLSKFAEQALIEAKQFGLLLLFSAAVMIFGGMFFTWFPEIIPGTFLFAAVLGGFMIAVGLGIMLASMFIKEGQKTILAMTLLVVLSGAMLLFAGWVMTQHPGMTKHIFEFIGADLLLIGGMALIVAGLSLLKTEILLGILGVAGIIVLTALSAYVLGMVGDFSKNTNRGDLMNGIAKMDVALLALVASYSAFGLAILVAMIPLGLAFVGLGMVNRLTLLTVHSLHKVIEVTKEYNKNPKAIQNFKIALTEFSDLGKTIASEFTGWWVLKLPFAISAVSSLGFALSTISKSIEEYASLKVPIYEGTKITGYRQLKDKDFSSAARNVTRVITTLGGAVISAYERNPEIFEADTKILGFPVGESKFAKVAKSLACLGPMLSKIAESVKEYADMKIAVYEGTKKVGYRHLEDTDFQNAATNVKHIIEVLGKAVIDSYDDNPEIFETNLWGTSKFSKVTKSLSQLGPMISTIAKGVKEYADLKIGEDYQKDKNGFLMPTKYRHLEDEDFQNAARNVKHIISVLGGAIIDVYEEHPDYYETSGGFLGFGSSSPFARTINANMKLGNLISKIASSVKDYADMKVGEDYQKDKHGFLMPTKYRHLNDKDFEDAAKNVKHIISVLGGAIIDVYNEHPDYYETSGGFFGLGGSSPFTKTIKANMELGTLISKIASAVKDYADMKVGEDYQKDKHGFLMPTKYRHLKSQDFKNAAENVKEIITTLGGAIIRVYNSNKDMFEGGWFSDSPFKKCISANMKMAELIDTIGKSIKDLASGNVATKWDEKTGKPIAFEQLGSKHFKAAAENIQLIITTLGNTIMQTYRAHEDWFDDGEDSTFAQACTAIGTMGNMINNIAQGIQAYADLKVPVYGEGGKIIKYDIITEQTFKDASTNIGLLVSNLGKTVIDLYKQHEDWFDDGPESDFSIACTAIGGMGEMLGKIAQGLQSYAELKFPIKWDEAGNPIDFKALSESDFENAGNNIAKVISTMGESIMGVYKGNEEMFETDPEKHPDSIFSKVVEGCSMMGEMISSIAEGIQAYAELRMPTAFDKNGKPIAFKQLNDGVFGKAAENIATIISTIGGAIDKAFYEHKDWFEHKTLKKAGGFLGTKTVEEPDPNDPPFIAAMQGCTMMGAMISSIAKGIQDYANLDMPLYDATGKEIGRQKLNDNIFTTAGDNIDQIITTIGNAIQKTYDSHKELFDGEKMKDIVKACSNMGQMISSISKGIQAYANLSYPIEWNDKGIAIKYQQLTDEEITSAGNTIATVLTTVGSAVSKTADDPMFSSMNTIKIMNMLNAMQKAGSVINTLGKSIKAFATMSFVEMDLSDPSKPKIKVTPIKPWEIKSSIENIGLVLTTIGGAIVDTVEGNEKVFGTNIMNSPAYMAAMAVGKMGEALNVIARSIGYYAKSQFPKLEYKDGKLTTTGYYKLAEQDYDAAKISIKNVILTLGEALAAAYNEHPELFQEDESTKKTIAQKVVEGIKIMSTSVQDAANIIGEMAKIDMSANQAKLTGIEDSLASNIKSIVNMYEIISQQHSNTIETSNWIGQKQSVDVMQSIGEWMSSKEKDLTKGVEGIRKFGDSLVTIAESISIIPEASNFNDEKLANLTPKFVNSINEFKTMANPLIEGSIFYAENSEKLFENIEILEQFIDEVKLIIEKASTIQDDKSLDTLASVIDKYTEIIRKLKNTLNTNSTNDNENSFFGGININKTSTELEEQIKFFGDNIERIIDLSKLSNENGPEGFQYISTGVSDIDNVMQNIRGLENFAKHNNQMQAYITTVNKLQSEKIDKLTRLVTAMHNLAGRMGNVDQLTAAIADKLSATLDKMVREMKVAEQVIKDSDEIQKRRHQMIEKSVNNITSIMKQKLLVEVTQVQDTTDLSTDSPSGGGSGGGSSNGSGDQQGGGSLGGSGGGQTTSQQGEDNKSGSQTDQKPSRTATITSVDRSESRRQGGGNSGYGYQQTKDYSGQLQSIIRTLQGVIRVHNE